MLNKHRMYYVYILKCNDSTYYAGLTHNLKKRINEHKNGIKSCVKHKRPIKLIFYCCFSEKDTAVQFERYLKTHSGKAFLNKRLVPKSLPGVVPQGTKTGGSSSVG
ncbi:MAG: GIY-YIG nuclease family protein [bacterium]|nr:GIY-YIG nuclease family protein [bacterium]